MIFIYANNVDTTLAGAISSSATSLTLSSSANLPASIPAGSVFVITMNDRATGQNFEIIYATSISGATLSGLLRGQDGTAAQAWLTNDYAYSAPTAGEMNGFGQLGANNSWTGNNAFTNPVAVGAATVDGQAAQYGQVLKTINTTILASGSGTYVTPSGAKVLRVRRVGGGGGGASSGTGAGNGFPGTASTFGSLPSCGGGGGGTTTAGGSGGLVAGSQVSVSGQQGSSGVPSNGANFPGGNGGASAFGGAGVGTISGNGTNAQANSGSGGGGAGAVSGAVGSSGGGGAGAFAEDWIINPASSYTYSVGVGGNGNLAGASWAGGNGANGQIIVEALI
ncbi:hypothetical protein AAB988_29395 [Burkholderia contaminans]|uniref:hypothetical protein n=1 Tax=Burkholderia contaminans TaxID=488447 RepID=UPI003116228B